MTPMPSPRRALAALALLLVGVLLSGCADHDDHMSGSGPGMSAGMSGMAARGAAVDLAFARMMIPHHESAIEMAKVAQERSKRREVMGLAKNIIRTQTAEITQLRAIERRLEQAGAKAGSLGMSDHAMGMDGDTAALRTADPFDRAFLSEMIPHHEGAVAMARMVLARGADDETRALSRSITSAQRAEIRDMRGWLADWYDAEAGMMSGSGHMG